MCETIFPLVSIGSVERDSVCEVLPVTIRLDAGTWDMLTEHLIDVYAFGMPEDTPPLDLRTRIRSFLESFLENHMQARDFLLKEANDSGT